MEPYGDNSRKVVSPLDKVQVENAKIDTPATTANNSG